MLTRRLGLIPLPLRRYLGTEIVALTAGEAENPRRCACPANGCGGQKADLVLPTSRSNVPKAIRRVFFRIVALCVRILLRARRRCRGLTSLRVRSYFIGTFVIGLIVSPNDPNLTNGDGVNASPWVIAIQNAGISALPSIVNAAVLLSAFSAGNSDL